MDVQIHGGFRRDGLAGRSPATGAASGAGMLVHPITCAQRRGETRRAEPGSEKGEKNSEADPSLPLQSLDLLANQRQHSELSLSLFFPSSWCPLFFLSLSESQNKTQSVVSPVNENIPRGNLTTQASRFPLCDLCLCCAFQRASKSFEMLHRRANATQKRKYVVSKKWHGRSFTQAVTFKKQTNNQTNKKNV